MPENNIPNLSISLVDALINAEVLLPQGEESEGYAGSNLIQVKVISHFCDENSNIIGSTNF